MASLRTRQSDALTRKLQSLGRELALWRQDSTGDLRLHHSQIQRVTAVLCGLRQEIREQRERGAADGIFNDRNIELGALELHRMWEFFRSKFALRKIDAFRPYLAAVDEFAWACYKPARDEAEDAGVIAQDALKEPPLVYLSGGWSPFAMPRNQQYTAESVPGERVRNAAFVQALKHLPVSVISLPWYQVEHLPDAVVVGHEVGHLIEDDLQLTGTIENAVRSAVPQVRQAAWLAWAGELFADVYGQLATGPSFVSALAEVLGIDWQSVVAEVLPDRGAWSEYPTSFLRMKVNFRLLEELGFGTRATALEAEWTELYGATHAMAAFDDDVPSVARALVECRFAQFAGRRMRDVLSFDASLVDAASNAVAQLNRPKAPDSGNVRALIASGRMFFDTTPAAYNDNVHRALLDALTASLPATGTRASRRNADSRDDSDRRTGASLLSVLTQH